LQQAKAAKEVKTLPAVISGVDNPRSPANSDGRTLASFSGGGNYDHGYDDYDEESEMKTMAAGLSKAQCLAVMDEVQAKRETVVITKHGKPVAKLVPADRETGDIYSFLQGKGTITGDVVSPAIVDWGDLK
jgi:antitoxin (DNA-binding transcriptional repressor) of toxin-antitoxin stability system